jgi:hypothetical protein
MTVTTDPPDSGAASCDQPASQDTENRATQKSVGAREEAENSDESSPTAIAADSAPIEPAGSGNAWVLLTGASASEEISAGSVHGDTAEHFCWELAATEEYLSTIPTRYQRSNSGTNRRSGRVRGMYLGRASGETRRSAALLAVGVRCTLKAQKHKEVLKLPSVKSRLKLLHARRPQFEEVKSPSAGVPTRLLEEEWPVEVKYIIESIVPEGIAFLNIGELNLCICEGDCFLDTCWNATAAIFCTPGCCRLGAVCSNAPRSLLMLKLFDTNRVGLGVFTTTFLNVGDVPG